MSLVAARCTQCGAELQVDNTQDAAVCTHCGTPFIIEKAINNYNTLITNNNNFDGASITVMGANEDTLITRAYDFLDSRNWYKAKEYAEKTLDINPQNGYAYLAIILSDRHCCSLTELKITPPYPIKTCIEYKKAIQYLDEEQASNLSETAAFISERAREQKKIEEQRHRELRIRALKSKHTFAILLIVSSIVLFLVWLVYIAICINHRSHFRMEIVWGCFACSCIVLLLGVKLLMSANKGIL